MACCTVLRTYLSLWSRMYIYIFLSVRACDIERNTFHDTINTCGYCRNGCERANTGEGARVTLKKKKVRWCSDVVRQCKQWLMRECCSVARRPNKFTHNYQGAPSAVSAGYLPPLHILCRVNNITWGIWQHPFEKEALLETLAVESRRQERLPPR